MKASITMRRRTGVAVLAAASSELAGIGLIALAAWLIASAAQQPLFGLLGTAIAGVRACALARGLLKYAERLAGHDAALRREENLRAGLFDALARLPRSGRWRGADLLTRFVSDSAAVTDRVLLYQIPLAATIATVLVTIFGFALMNVTAAVVLTAGVVLAGAVIPAGALLASRSLTGQVVVFRAVLSTAISDVLDGAAELTIYGARDRYEQHVTDAAATRAALRQRQGVVMSVAGGTIAVAQVVTTLAVAVAAGPYGATPVAIIVLSLAAFVVFEPLRMVPQMLHAGRISAAALDRVTEVQKAWESKAPADRASPTTQNLPVSLRQVTVHWSDGVVLPDRAAVLSRVSASFAPGSRTIITGPSGAGKSTLLALIAGTVVPDQGAVLVGDRPSVVRAEGAVAVAGVTDDSYLFDSSIADNLRIGRADANGELLWQALEAVQLSADVAQLPNALDTPVGKHGHELSGGQRKRLLIARALLADPAVIVLDEPTESLDADLACRVIAGVLAWSPSATVLMVTHDLSLGNGFDQTLVVDAGQVRFSK